MSTPTAKYDKENALDGLIKREQEIMARTPELLDIHDKHLGNKPFIELSLLEEVRRGNVRVCHFHFISAYFFVFCYDISLSFLILASS